jgi:hypothetical protein
MQTFNTTLLPDVPSQSSSGISVRDLAPFCTNMFMLVFLFDFTLYRTHCMEEEKFEFYAFSDNP